MIYIPPSLTNKTADSQGVTLSEVGKVRYNATVTGVTEGKWLIEGSTVTMPVANQLYKADGKLDTRILFEENGTPKAVLYADIVSDEQSKGVIFANIYSILGLKFNWLVYATQKTGDSLYKVLNFIKAIIYLFTTEDGEDIYTRKN